MPDAADRREILDCLTRYARGIDRLDVPLVLSAFHDDAIDCHGEFTGSPAEFVAWWLPRQARRDVVQHYLMNHSAEFDGAVAHTETYFVAVLKQAGEQRASVNGGRYVDRFERRAGVWRIAVRVVARDWALEGDASGMALAMRGLHRGHRGDGRDVSYERPLQPRRPPSLGGDRDRS